MASGKAEWIFSIIDKASGPTSMIERKLGLLEKRLSAVDRAAKSASDPATRDRANFKKLGLELQRDQLLMRKLNDESGTWVRNLHAGLGAIGMIGGALRTVVGGMADLGIGAAKVTAAFGKKGIEAGAYRETNIAALEVLLGDKGKANAAFEFGQQFASETPFKISDVMRWQKNLLVGGFSQDDAKVIMKGLGDMGAMNDFDTQVVDRAALALKQIKAKGRLMGQEMLQLAEAGVNQGAVYKHLSKMTGLDDVGVRKLQEKGGISADMGIYAIMAAAKDTTSGGVLGGAMEKFGKGTLTGLLSTLFDKPDAYLAKLGDSRGFETFKSAVTTTIQVLDTKSETGKRISSTLETTFDRLFENVFGRFTGPDGPAQVEKTIERMLAGFERVTQVGQVTITALEGVADGFLKGIDPAGKMFGEDGLSPEKLQRVAEAGEKLGSSLAKVADAFSSLFGDLFDRNTLLGRMIGNRLDDMSEYGVVGGTLKGGFESALGIGMIRDVGGWADNRLNAFEKQLFDDKSEQSVDSSNGNMGLRATAPAIERRSTMVQINAPISLPAGLNYTPAEIQSIASDAGRQTAEAVAGALSSAAASQGA